MYIRRTHRTQHSIIRTALAALVFSGVCAMPCQTVQAQNQPPIQDSAVSSGKTSDNPTSAFPRLPQKLTAQQQAQLSQTLVSSAIHGTLDGLNHPRIPDEQAVEPLIQLNTEQEFMTWQSWLAYHGMRWLHTLGGRWHALKHLEQPKLDDKTLEILTHELGMAQIQDADTKHSQLVSTSETPDKLRALLTTDLPVFDVMQNLYTQIHQNQGVALEQLLSNEIDKLFSTANKTLDHRTKMVIYATILPQLIEHANNSNAQITVRKLQEAQRSLNRLLNGARHVITCRENATPVHAEITFEPSLVIPDTHGSYLIHTFDTAHDRFPATRVSCQITETQEPALPINLRTQQAIDDAMAAIESKDNDATILAMHQLAQTLRAFTHEYGISAAWNEHRDDAPTDKWLCQLQIITLIALDQNRFGEMAELDRAIQLAFDGSTFYQRMTMLDACPNLISNDDLTILDSLKNEFINAYDWIIKNYAPKTRKKFDKNFSKWTRKVKRNVALTRRLLAAWTVWSDGDYEKAAKYAGPNITKGKSRIVHPQLHSFDLILKAIRGDEISREDLETYISVVQLKTPAVVYQALTEAYPWFDEAKRQEVVEIISRYSPAQAPAAAARFYQTYELEFQQRLNASKRAAIGAWLETELRAGESPAQTQARREKWLKNIQEADEHKSFEHLMQVIKKDWDELSPQSQDFWSQVKI